MKSLLLTASVLAIFSATTTLAQCVVPLVIATTLSTPFTLAIQAPGSAVQNHTINFIPRQKNSSLYDVVVSPAGETQNVTLTKGHLFLEDGGEEAFLVTPRDKARFRKVMFGKDGGKEEGGSETPEVPKFQGFFQCGPDDTAQFIIGPQTGNGELCVLKDAATGVYGLWMGTAGKWFALVRDWWRWRRWEEEDGEVGRGEGEVGRGGFIG